MKSSSRFDRRGKSLAAHKSRPRPIVESLISTDGKVAWKVPLTQGKCAIIDDEDYETISAYNWNWVSHRNYARTTVWAAGKGHGVVMHRFILNAPEGVEVDHINGDGLDNRRANLRLCTRSENMRNRRRWKLKNSPETRAKGVSKLPNGKFKAQITLGTFDSEHEAAEAYDRAARTLFGAFARLNSTSK